MENFDFKILESLLLGYGVNILWAIVVLVIGLKLSNSIVKIVQKVLDKKEVDESLKPFLSSLVSWVLKICVFITAINTAGVQTTSFIALLGTIGLAIGMALQGSLSNFAGGVIILLLKPFKVGDVIKAQGFVGSVEKITVFSTILKTPDNQVINIPNGSLANAAIVNINQEATRRVDFTFGISYDDNIKQAKEILSAIATNDSRVLKDPAPQIVVGELADSSVNLILRVWVDTPNYWDVHFDFIEQVKEKFDQEKVSFPFPQTDVHLHQVQ